MFLVFAIRRMHVSYSWSKDFAFLIIGLSLLYIGLPIAYFMYCHEIIEALSFRIRVAVFGVDFEKASY